jgi:hypothetical protein
MPGKTVAGVFFSLAGIVGFFGIGARPASAVIIRGIDFPAGDLSFMDEVVSYSPEGVGIPNAPHRDPFTSLGRPDFNGDNNCTGDPRCTFVSLGSGGNIVLRFTDNSLTGSGDSAFDLHVFEIGPDVEDTFVDISKDGVDWFSVGKVLGSTASIDIDRFGFGPTDFFYFVRLTDDPNEGAITGIQVGADIDSVGAITSGPPPSTPPSVAEPGTLLLLGAGLVGWALTKARRLE